MDEIAHLLSELDRLHHRQAELRSYERRLAECGENDPASDTWKTAAIVAASAEADFQAALVRNWPALAAFLREAVAVPAGMTADQAWQDLCEKDDRTSIDYPGFALIRQDELAGYMAAAPVSPPADSGDDDAEHCIACDEPFKDGDLVYPDVSGGHIHDKCADDGGFTTKDRPEPQMWPLASTPAPQPGGAVKEVVANYLAGLFGEAVAPRHRAWAHELIDRILSALSPSPSGWDAGAEAKDWRERDLDLIAQHEKAKAFEAGAKAMQSDAAALADKLGEEYCTAGYAADKIRDLPLPTPPAGEG